MVHVVFLQCASVALLAHRQPVPMAIGAGCSKARCAVAVKREKIISLGPKALKFELLLGFNELWIGLYDYDKTMANCVCNKD